MANNFSATDDFLCALDTVKKVGLSLTTPVALSSSQLSVTNAICCATTVLLSGYFESFLKAIVKEFIELVNGLANPLSSIPYPMQLRHYIGGAQALGEATRRDKELKSTALSQDLTARLASLGSVTGYVLAWEAFAQTKANPNTETVSEILGGLEIEKVWIALNDLQMQHGRLDTFLTSFIKMRHVCAHTGTHSTPPSGVDIIGFAETFGALAECIDMLVALRLAQFR